MTRAASRRKRSPGWTWAERHLLDQPAARALWAFQAKLEASQWYGPDRHRAFQHRQLEPLLRHAVANVPLYAERLKGFDPARAADVEAWRSLPILTRRDLQQHGERLKATSIPRGHGDLSTTKSSGSTGQPVETVHTAVSANWHRSLSLRATLWAHARFDGKLAVVRRYRAGVADYPEGRAGERWADPADLPFATGPVAMLNVNTPVPDQIEWIVRQKPAALMTFPSSLDAVCRHALAHGIRLPRLRGITTVAESAPEGLRGAARRAFGAEIADTYSAYEVGEIAIQCPAGEAYHIQSESVLVEVLDDNGAPCGPGETGRIVLTPLHNYAMPLIRYAIGDLATVGPPCRCGRGLPVLKKVLGRVRNMMVRPDGSSFWPSFGVRNYRDHAPVIQAQVIQHAVDRLEVRMAVERPLTPEEERALRDLVAARAAVPVDVAFSYTEELPRGPGGKFEEFVSLVETG